MTSPRPLRVVLVAFNRGGHRSLALGYLRAYAEAYAPLVGKASFQTLDLSDDVDPWWAAWRVLGLEPDVVAFSVYCWSAKSALECARLVKSVRPEAAVVFGGPEVGPVAREVLEANSAVDAVVRGEGELTFSELLKALHTGGRASAVDGVTARKGEGIAEAPDRPVISDLDSIPSPYLSGILTPEDGVTYLETYRGCPHSCAYCFEGKGYGRIRRFSRDRVAAEIAEVAGAPAVRSFSFIDPVFNLTEQDLAWLAETLEPYARSGTRLHTVEVDIERIGEDQAELLARAGVVSVETGPQTTGAAALEACRRKFDPDRFASGVAALRRRGISVECDLIVGLPGDSALDHVASLRWCLKLDPGAVRSSTLHVLPGTELWARSVELGLEFDVQAPHEIIATPHASYRDLRRAEVLGEAVRKQYEAHV